MILTNLRDGVDTIYSFICLRPSTVVLLYRKSILARMTTLPTLYYSPYKELKSLFMLFKEENNKTSQQLTKWPIDSNEFGSVAHLNTLFVITLSGIWFKIKGKLSTWQTYSSTTITFRLKFLQWNTDKSNEYWSSTFPKKKKKLLYLPVKTQNTHHVEGTTLSIIKVIDT